MPPVADTEEVEVEEIVLGPLRANWQDLGTAAGSAGVGLARARIEPGARSAPLHRHGVNEEAHTLGAGPEGLDVLVFGLRATDEATHLPRAGVIRLNEAWVEAAGLPDHWDFATA